MSVDPRSEIMARIRAALGSTHPGGVGVAAVGYSRPEAIHTEDPKALCARFLQELALVDGDTVIVTKNGDDALAHAVADLVASRGYCRVAVHSHPLAVRAASLVEPSHIIGSSGATAAQIESADCAILGADALIAETGSAVVQLGTYEERLLPYLPPACIIVADAACVSERFDAAAFAAATDERGERVIITGPSRTADIEKTIVLGAHGPASLTVIIADLI
jgi:L-lactate dehydrogenase complex protein LldG